jgi:hypothetical protein
MSRHILRFGYNSGEFGAYLVILADLLSVRGQFGAIGEICVGTQAGK